MRVLARREELAEDLLQHDEVVDLSAGDRGERFIEEKHALVVAVGVDETRAQVRERHELEVAVVEVPSYLECASEEFVLPGAVAFEHAEAERDPTASRESRSPRSVSARANHPRMTAGSPTIVPCR